MIVKKVLQKRIIVEDSQLTKMRLEGYGSDKSEKKDDSCEETIEEVDEFGNKKVYVVKRSIEKKKPSTMDIVNERRELRGLSSYTGEMYKPVTQSPESKHEPSS